MQWFVVYRRSSMGVWQAIAEFMFYADGRQYLNMLNEQEPRRYIGQVEARP